MARGFEIVNSGDRYRINTPSVIGQTFDDEAVIVNLMTGNYYNMNKIATEIWNALQIHIDRGTIVTILTRKYHGTIAEIENVVGDLLGKLLAEELIAPTDPAEPMSVDLAPRIENETKMPIEAAVLYKYTDLQELLLLDPIHEVDETGWPNRRLGKGPADDPAKAREKGGS